MSLTLMYHQINTPGKEYGVVEFTKHLEYLVNNFEITVPPSKLSNNKAGYSNNYDDENDNKDYKENSQDSNNSICLTFDDAYYDFYYYVYPLLKKYNIQAILGIPTAFIRKRSTLGSEKRLSVSYPAGLEKNNLQHNTPLCTWLEIQEMVKSGHVIPASHSHTHSDLTSVNTDLTKEIVHSKNILESELNCEVSSFIYPFGKMNFKVHEQVMQNYKYIFRIGSAANKNWSNRNNLFYRVDANHIWPKSKIISKSLMRKYKFKYFLNKIRFK